MYHLYQHVTHILIRMIAHLGYAGLFTGMLAQAVGIPLSSELMLSFAGYLASTHVVSLLAVIAAGAAGDVAGAAVAYLIGYYGGRPLLMRFGRLFFVRERELERADEWFARHGRRAVLILKLLPGVRAFGSYPAGVTRMALGAFLAYTAIGSVIWSALFCEVGYTLGRNWPLLGAYARPASFVLLGLVAAAVIGWLWVHLRAERRAVKPS